jgi:hypothetical protein
VHNPDEFFAAYDRTGTYVMMLQEAIAFESYYRCYCVGREHVRIMPYEPRNEHAFRYQANYPPLQPELEQRIIKDTLTLNRALATISTPKFAVRDGCLRHRLHELRPTRPASVGGELRLIVGRWGAARSTA